MTLDRKPFLWMRTVALPVRVVIAAPFATAAVAWLAYAPLGLGTGWSKALALAVFMAMTTGPYLALLWCGARADRESARLAADIAAVPVDEPGDGRARR